MTLVDLIGKELSSDICTKSLEKRTSAAIDLESLIIKTCTGGDSDSRRWADECIKCISDELIASVQTHHRIGGLVSLSSIARGSRGQLLPGSIALAVRSCYECTGDDEFKVRLAACETLHNIVKSCRAQVLPDFKSVFESICRLSGDPEMEVRAAAPALDRQIKEVIIEFYKSGDLCAVLSITQVIEASLFLPNIYVKQACVSWIALLKSVPQSGLFDHLGSYLPGLISQLCSDSSSLPGWKDLSASTDHLLKLLLKDIEEKRVVVSDAAVQKCLTSLIKYCQFQESLTSTRVRIVLFDWVRVLAPLSSSSTACSSIVVILMKSLVLNPNEPVAGAVRSCHHALLKSDTFKSQICMSREALIADLEGLLANATARGVVTNSIIDWIKCACEGMIVLRSLNIFFKLELNQEILQLCFSQFGSHQVADRLVVYSKSFDSKPQLANLILKSVSNSSELSVVISTIAKNSRDSHFMMEIIKQSLLSTDFCEIWTHDLVGSCLDSPLVEHNRVAAMAIAIHAKRWDDLENISHGLNISDRKFLNELADIFESDVFISHRLALLSEPALARSLVRASMYMEQSTTGLQRLTSRLQLFTVFKSAS